MTVENKDYDIGNAERLDCLLVWKRVLELKWYVKMRLIAELYKMSYTQNGLKRKQKITERWNTISVTGCSGDKKKKKKEKIPRHSRRERKGPQCY